jgi:exonuclease SbcC
MATKRLFRSALHLDSDPARRIEGVAALAPDADELAQLMAADPAPDVRAAAARRCNGLVALVAAWEKETDATVREAIAPSLAIALAASPGSAAGAFLHAETCADAIRADVARHATDAERSRAAIAAIRDEAVLVDLALHAGHAGTRMAAAERVLSPEGLKKLAEAASSKDRGVARHAKKRIEAEADREGREAEADAIVAEMEALHLSDDPGRLARCDAARKVLQERFDREHEAQRARARFEQGLAAWLANTEPPASTDALAERLHALAALREEARTDAGARARLEEAESRIERWTQELNAHAAAEALVVEAETLAAGTSIDDAKLPERWEALDRQTRTPALTRRFEAALMVVGERRLAQVRAAEKEASAAKQRVHDLLHAAEQALAAGHLQEARAAAEEIRARKAEAGALPKPTVQRLSRVVQQLHDMEKWESFGQKQARLQLCERAEALAAGTLDPKRVAVDVKHLRDEWKTLDQQHAGVPKALWERFDQACEKAYAPAARFFAEQAAKRKEAKKGREEFIAAAAAHAPTLVASEPRDWKAIERWIRETEHHWREGDLGSVDPKAWKGFDAKFRAALAPARDALHAARDEAKARRVALIEEATALQAKATDRDAPSQVKAIQTKWQAQAKELALLQRDERVLWEQFRAACNAVFEAREAKRRSADDRKHEGRRALEDICARLEALAGAVDGEEPELRRGLREAIDQWRAATRRPNEAPRGLDARFTNAKSALEVALSARSRAKEAAVWQTLAAKESICAGLDRHAVEGTGTAETATAAIEQWAALPALPAAWEKSMVARRDAAIAALGDEDAADALYASIEDGAEARAEILLDLEMQLGLEIPPELQQQRLALQVKKLRDRFQSAASASANSPGEKLVAWCATAGMAAERERERVQRVVGAVGRGR